MHFFALIGQALIGVVFLAGAVTDVLGRQTLLQILKTKKLRYEEYLLYGAIGLKVVCGLALIVNIWAPFAAFLLAGFTIIANVLFHPFWAVPPGDRQKEYFAFLIHVAVIGGLLVIVGS
jgi:putative oxidoreductase